MNDNDRFDLSGLREESPAVVNAAFGRFRRRLLFGALVLSLIVGAVGFFTGRSQSDEERLQEVLGDTAHGPLHLISQQLVGGQEWKIYAYLDADGRPCLIETLGGGSCHPHAGRIKGEVADYGSSGGSWKNEGEPRVEYIVVAGAVPSDIETVLIEFDDGTVERVQTHAPPNFEDRVFALLSEGSIDREVVDIRAVD